jgi:hypothetical protein
MNRQSFAEALRTTTHPQCVNSWMQYGFQGPVDECPVCATTVLLLHLGQDIHAEDGKVISWGTSFMPGVLQREHRLDWLAIVADNDRGLSFREIADKLEQGAYDL